MLPVEHSSKILPTESKFVVERWGERMLCSGGYRLTRASLSVLWSVGRRFMPDLLAPR